MPKIEKFWVYFHYENLYAHQFWENVRVAPQPPAHILGKEEASNGGESVWIKSCQYFFHRISVVRMDQNDQISYYYQSEWLNNA